MGSQVACGQTGSPTSPAPESTTSQGAIIDNNSLMVGEIKTVKSISTRYSWEIDVLVKSVQNVNTLPNPISDKVGQVISCQTNEDATKLKSGQTITANVQLSGDVERGTILYIHNIR